MMGRYSNKSLATLRERIDLLEVVSPYVQLKLAGSTYKGICPFHSEKTPSFVIQKDKSHYHCFGCGAHGDGIKFIMEYLSLPFSDAVDLLATKFQVRMELVTHEDNSSNRQTQKTLLEVLSQSAAFFHGALLHTTEGEIAIRYLHSRGIDLNTIVKFQIGYDPRNGNIFALWAKKEAISPELLKQVGVIKADPSKSIFSGKIIFPIFDRMGRVIAFSARSIKNTELPKYINSPETPMFKKSLTLYGLNWSRKNITAKKGAIIVEGQMDAIKLMKKGFDTVVSVLGTALTEEHVKELSHLGVLMAHLIYDGDIAGRNAMFKAGHLLQSQGIETRVVVLPDGMDPDDVIDSGPCSEMDRFINSSIEYIQYVVNHLSQGKDLKSPFQKYQIANEAVLIIKGWKTQLLIHESMKKLAEMLSVPLYLLEMPSQYWVSVGKPSISKKIDTDRLVEMDLLRWLIIASENSDHKIMKDMILDSVRQEWFQVSECADIFILFKPSHQQTQHVSEILRMLCDNGKGNIVQELMEKKIDRNRIKDGISDTISKIKTRHILGTINRIREKIQNQKHTDEELLSLTKQFDKMRMEIDHHRST